MTNPLPLPVTGLSAARARGRQGGRPKKLDAHKAEMAQRLYNDKSKSIDDICKTLGISRATLYRYVSREQSQKTATPTGS